MVADVLLFGELERRAVCVLSRSLLPVGCRARVLTRGSSRGALNAGRAWILGGGAVDGFEQCLLFQFSGVCASKGLSFFIGLQ